MKGLDILKLFIYLTLMKFIVFLSVYFTSGQNFFYLITTRWDSKLFETIAQYGYVKSYLYAFPPIYPFLINLVHNVTNNYYISAFVVTNIFGYLFPVIIYKTFDYNTALIVELFPIYVIYSTLPYSDVIYLTAIALTFYFLKRDKILIASTFMGFAIANFYSVALTLPSFIVELKKSFIKFIIIPLFSGFSIFAWYYISTGTPFYYFEIEKNTWGVKFTTPISQANWLLHGWFTTQDWTILSIKLTPIDWLIRNLCFEIFFVILTINLVRLKDNNKWLYFTYSILVIIPLLFIIGTPAISIPRILLSAFPAFYSLRIEGIWIILYVVISIILTSLFTLWQIYAFFA
ncbi:hypothetical protein [Sulfolobus sp. S-194]|uniref:hypothetical protein n=1 Tax=Sulfolobus sp. S-194 TaxID=2512240 RepID=UPI0019D04DC5|nr:hypothetical protein [Sulfolobus sp. S-194]